jgi:hypothetical protein
LAVAVGWVVAGVFVRWRFRFVRCREIEAASTMVIYV